MVKIGVSSPTLRQRMCGVRWQAWNYNIYFTAIASVPSWSKPPSNRPENVIFLTKWRNAFCSPRSSLRLQLQFKRYCHGSLCQVHSIRFLPNIPITFLLWSTVTTLLFPPASPTTTLSLGFRFFFRVAITLSCPRMPINTKPAKNGAPGRI